MTDKLHVELVALVRANPDLMNVLRIVRSLRLPDWRIVAGAVYQTVWNARTGRAHNYGIKDYDVAYFDASDIFWDAEDAVIRHVLASFDEPCEQSQRRINAKGMRGRQRARAATTSC